MTESPNDNALDYDCIFIWSRGGAGHKAVMDAKKQEWAAKGNYRLLDLDIMGDAFLNSFSVPFMGKFGDFCVSFWNGAQIAGNITRQTILVKVQWLAEILFYPIIYFKIKKILEGLTKPLECIIVTQPLCNTAIARAMRKINLERKWNMRLDIWMSDLPTEKATHFFSSIKKIARNKKLRPLVTLYSPRPDIGVEISDEAWWRKNCGNIRVITDQPYPIRKAFLDQQSLLGQSVELSLRNDQGKKLNFNIRKEDKIATLMLGSQPSKRAVLDYIDIVIKLARAKRKKLESKKIEARYYLFVFCGESDRNDSLRKEIESRVEAGKFPVFLRIIPFSYQSDEELAPLLARSDLTLTRSGGSTAMELMHLNRDKKGITLIHSENYDIRPQFFARFLQVNRLRSKFWKILKKNPDSSTDKEMLLTKGVIRWEVGNAEYLKKKIEAQVVSPAQIEHVLKQVFFSYN
jgi:hypothetical protein